MKPIESPILRQLLSHGRTTATMLLAAPPLLALPVMGGPVNEMFQGDSLTTRSNWSLDDQVSDPPVNGSPIATANGGSHTDFLFTSPVTTLNATGSIIYGGSYNVSNGSSYVIRSNRAPTDPASLTTFRIGSLASGTSFTNAVSGISNDLVYLSNNSNLTFDGVNAAEGGLPPVLDLRLSTGNFNVSAGSKLTVGMSLTGSGGTRAVVVTGNGNTLLSGTNTYTGRTTVSGGTLEISGTNTGALYTLIGAVSPSEPILKLSNVNALPVTANLTGSTSTATDGIVDLAVAGTYSLGVYNGGNMTFTTSSGSATTLTFSDPSRISSGTDNARTFNNANSLLHIVFSGTLDIGSSTTSTGTAVTISGSGRTTVNGGISSTGTAVRGLSKSGSGTLTINGPSSYAGTTTLGAGILRLGDANALPGGVGATGGTSNLHFNSTSAIIGLTEASGDFRRKVGTGADQVVANPAADAALVRNMGFAAYGGDRVVDFGASIMLSSASLAGRGLVLGAADSDSKITLVNGINLANSIRTILVNDGSAAVDAELSGVIISPGATLVKTGAGTLALTGTNTYGETGGGTEIRAGVLAVDGDSLSDTSKLVIDGGRVQSSGSETVATLFFGDVQQAAGTWGSSQSSALPAFQDDERFSGTGVIVVTGGPATGYAGWAEGNAGGQAASLDYDNDGVSNGTEYFMGQTGSSFTPNPGLIAGKVTWPRDPAAVASFKIQISDNLASGGWTDIVPPHASIDQSNPNQVVFTLPVEGPGRFCRLVVEP